MIDQFLKKLENTYLNNSVAGYYVAFNGQSFKETFDYQNGPLHTMEEVHAHIETVKREWREEGVEVREVELYMINYKQLEMK